MFALVWFSLGHSVEAVLLTVARLEFLCRQIRQPGGAADCGPVGVSVSPNTATADHTAAQPGNQQQFVAFNSFPIKQGCPAITAAILNNVTWSTSDPGNVSISNTQGPTCGVATCINSVSSAVTITATQRRQGGSTFYRHRIADMQMKTRP